MGQNLSTIWENCLKRDKDKAKGKKEPEPEPEPVTEPYPPIDPQTVVRMRPSEEPLETPTARESIPSRPWSDSDLDLPLPPGSIVSNRQSILLPQLSNSPTPNLLHLQNRLQVTIVPPSPNSKYLFAGKRFSNSQGSSFIFLISPKTCELFKVPEEQLKEWYNIVLGDFLTVKIDASRSLYDMEKAKAIGNAQVKVEEDTAYILNVPVKLVNLDGKCVFQSEKFADAVSKEELEIGSYFVRISVLSEPIHLTDGKILFLEGTNAKPRHDGSKKPKKVKIADVPADPQPQQMIYGAGFPEFQEDSEDLPEPSTILEQLSKELTEDSEPEPEKMIYGAGFPVFQGDSGEEDLPEQSLILEDLPSIEDILNGVRKQFKKDQQDNDVIIPDKYNKKELFSARALVIDIISQKGKHPIRLLWVLDHKVEARLKKTASPLPIGHFFQGSFQPHPHFPGQLLCMEYEKELEVQIPWSLDEAGKIWLVVKLENAKDGEAEAEGIGNVVDGETENTKISERSNGKKVRIQRFQIEETQNIDTGHYYFETELVLQTFGVHLGDFLHGIPTGKEKIKEISKTEVPNGLRVTVTRDEAYVEDVKATVICKEDFLLFKTDLFANALCRDNLEPGKEFTIKISL